MMKRIQLRSLLLLFFVCGRAVAQTTIIPTKVISLFNGKDLSSFTTWDRKNGREDKDHVFTVVERIDNAPAIRISGQHFGGIITRERYANYRFVAEFRWGLITWEPRRDKSRDGGVLLHCQGEEGNDAPDFRGPFMRSVEYQIIEGGTGDLILVRGYDRGKPDLICPTLHTTITPGSRTWNPEGEPVLLTIGRHRTDWQHKDPQWKDELGFRGRNDVEKSTGQWNRLEAICDGGDVTFFLNGVKVNEGRDGSLKEGRILIQSEGAEMYFRNVELHPLKR
jgi:hypothetical protein